MLLLIVGVALWVAVHFWKRIAPDHRARFGDKGKIVVAVGTVVAIVLMVFGYRAAEGYVYWDRTSAMAGQDVPASTSGRIASSNAVASIGRGKAKNARQSRTVGCCMWSRRRLAVWWSVAA